MEKLVVIKGYDFAEVRDINNELTKGWTIKSITTGTSGSGTCYAYVVLQKKQELVTD